MYCPNTLHEWVNKYVQLTKGQALYPDKYHMAGTNNSGQIEVAITQYRGKLF